MLSLAQAGCSPHTLHFHSKLQSLVPVALYCTQCTCTVTAFAFVLHLIPPPHPCLVPLFAGTAKVGAVAVVTAMVGTGSKLRKLQLEGTARCTMYCTVSSVSTAATSSHVSHGRFDTPRSAATVGTAGCGIDDEAAKVLMDVVKKCSKLNHVALKGANSGDVLLHSFGTQRLLVLPGNSFGDDGAKALAAAFCECHLLEEATLTRKL